MDRSAEDLLSFCATNERNYEVCRDWNVWNEFAQDNFQLSLELVDDDAPPIELYRRLSDLYRNRPQALIVPLILQDQLERLATFLNYSPLVRPLNLFAGSIELDPQTERILAVAVDSGSSEILNLLLNHLTQYGTAPLEPILERTSERAALMGRVDLLDVIDNYQSRDLLPLIEVLP